MPAGVDIAVAVVTNPSGHRTVMQHILIPSCVFVTFLILTTLCPQNCMQSDEAKVASIHLIQIDVLILIHCKNLVLFSSRGQAVSPNEMYDVCSWSKVQRI